MTQGKYNTYVIHTDKFNAIRKVASEVGAVEAYNVEAKEGRKWDRIDYFIQSYEVGSERDMECQKDLRKKVR